MRGGTKVKPPIFFLLRNNNYSYNEIYTCHGYILHNDEIILPPSLLHYQHTFSAFASDAVCFSYLPQGRSSSSTTYRWPRTASFRKSKDVKPEGVNPLNPELNPICYLLALLGAHHFLHVSRIRVKLLSFVRMVRGL